MKEVTSFPEDRRPFIEVTSAQPPFPALSPAPEYLMATESAAMDDLFGKVDGKMDPIATANERKAQMRSDVQKLTRIKCFQEYTLLAVDGLKKFYATLTIDAQARRVLEGEMEKILRSVAAFGDCYTPIGKYFAGGMFFSDISKRVECLIPVLYDMLSVEKRFIQPNRVTSDAVKSFWNYSAKHIDASVPLFKQSGMPFPSSGSNYEKNIQCYMLHRRLVSLMREGKIDFRDFDRFNVLPVISRRISYGFGKIAQYPVDHIDRTTAVKTNLSVKIRAIYMSPKCFKYVLGPSADVLVAQQKATGLYSPSEKSILTKLERLGPTFALQNFSSDFSNYDNTQSEVFSNLVANMAYEEFPALMREWEHRDVSQSSLIRTPTGWAKLGFSGNQSGSPWTTPRNNIANVAEFLYVHSMLTRGRYDSSLVRPYFSSVLRSMNPESHSDVQMLFAVAGDDRLSLVRPGIRSYTPQEYADYANENCFDTKLEVGPIFLKKLYAYNLQSGEHVVMGLPSASITNRLGGERTTKHWVPFLLGWYSVLSNLVPKNKDMVYSRPSNLPECYVLARLLNSAYLASVDFWQLQDSQMIFSKNIPLPNSLLGVIEFVESSVGRQAIMDYSTRVTPDSVAFFDTLQYQSGLQDLQEIGLLDTDVFSAAMVEKASALLNSNFVKRVEQCNSIYELIAIHHEL